METYIFNLPSGVEIEVKELKGKHQRILTQKRKGISYTENLFSILADVIERVGSDKNIDLNFVKNMLDVDRRFALLGVRQFTMEFENVIEFDYSYTDDDKTQYKVHVHEELKDGIFTMDPIKEFKDGEFVDQIHDEYSDIDKYFYCTLPKSKLKVRLTRLRKEVKIKNVSSHTPIEVRRPVEMRKSDKADKVVPIQLNLDNLGFKDIEYLRKHVMKCEGDVFSSIKIYKPNHEDLVGDDQFKDIDVLSSTAFFFPSGLI